LNPSSKIVPKPFKERQEYYLKKLGGRGDHSWRRHYDVINSVFTLLKYNKIKTVVELGCFDGALAVKLLNELPYFLDWTGYDFLQSLIDKSHIHSKYKPILLDRPLWDMPEVEPFDVFVCSHTLEHLYSEDVEALVNWLSPRAKYLLLIAPLGRKSTPISPRRPLHILDKGSLWLAEILKEAGFKSVWETHRWFGWFKR
jgi:2-polyprenyl-3-methyl-5-hydroxy-6-metoxy-1,4-benzoquinol methylase